MNETIALIVGYLASVFLAFSLLVNNDFKFRWLSVVGCITFIIYGILISAFPVILTNGILFLINIFQLIKIYRRNENFDLLEFNIDDKLILKFISFHERDIKNYFPEFEMNEQKGDLNFAVLRDMVIANIFVATVLNDGTALVKLNYTIPKYRDYKIGKFLFQKEKKLLLSRGIKRLVYSKVHNQQHEKYLLKMGFEKELLEGQVYYHKDIQ